MPPVEDQLRLRHMLNAGKEAADAVRGKSRTDFDRERILQLAVVRLLEIVGEAAGRVTADFRDQNSAIPWPQIVGLRNRLIHGYDSVDLDILWEILTRDLPVLISNLEQILAVP